MHTFPPQPRYLLLFFLSLIEVRTETLLLFSQSCLSQIFPWCRACQRGAQSILQFITCVTLCLKVWFLSHLKHHNSAVPGESRHTKEKNESMVVRQQTETADTRPCEYTMSVWRTSQRERFSHVRAPSVVLQHFRSQLRFTNSLFTWELMAVCARCVDSCPINKNAKKPDAHCTLCTFGEINEPSWQKVSTNWSIYSSFDFNFNTFYEAHVHNSL